MKEDLRGRPLASALLVAAVLALVWGALAFGGVYPWAYRPLAITCAGVGVLSFATRGRDDGRTTPLALACAAIGLAAALQLLPLTQEVLEKVSPGTHRFLSEYDLSYQAAALLAQGRDASVSPARWPISLAPTATVLGLALFLSFGVFMLGLVRILGATGALGAVRAIVVFGLALAVFAIGQYVLSGGETYLLKIYGFWQPTYRGSPFGPFVNRNHFAGWMLMVLPLAVMGAFGAAVSQRHQGFRGIVSWLSLSPSATWMLTMTLAAVLMGLAILLSQSRSGMAALVIEGILIGTFVVRQQSSRRARLVTVLVLVVISLGIVAWAGVDRLLTRAASVPQDLPTGGGRLGAWRDTARIIGDFPLTGTGLNTYKTAMIVYQSGARALHFQEAHNDYLQLAAEGGLLIGIPVVALLVSFVRVVRRRFAEAPREGSTYWFRGGAVVGLLGIAAQALVEFSLQMPGNAALFAMIAALALHRSPNLRSRSAPAALVIEMPVAH